jgi:hypothetical protein
MSRPDKTSRFLLLEPPRDFLAEAAKNYLGERFTTG